MYAYRQKRHTRLNEGQRILRERGLSEGQRILLERQGAIWEGPLNKEIPAWMKQPKTAEHKPVAPRQNFLARAGHIIAAVLGLGVK